MTKIKLQYVALLIIKIFIANICKAQSLSPQIISSASIKMNQNIGSLTFTVGELVIKSSTDSNGNILNSGVLNSVAQSITVLAINFQNNEKLNINVYPNPTKENLTIEIEKNDMNNIIVEIFDMQGKIRNNQNIGKSNKTSINTANISAGTYLLLLKTEDGKILNKYSIVKQ